MQQTNQQTPLVVCAWVDLIQTVTKLWLHFHEICCLVMRSMQKVCDSFQWEPDQEWQEEVWRTSTENQPQQERKAARNCFAHATVPVAHRAVTGQGNDGLPFPRTYEELTWLPSPLPIPPHNEKNPRAMWLNGGMPSLDSASDHTTVRAPPRTLEGHFWEHFFLRRSLCRGREWVPR